METWIYKCVDCNCIIQFDSEQRHVRCTKCGKDDVRLRMVRYGRKQISNDCGDYSLVSESLAISPDQIADHRRMFPDVEVFEDGRLGFNSFRSHDKYLEKTGFVKRTQKIRNSL